MFQIILYEPEIPPNTGNVIRLCANTGSTLHLIRPLGFDISDKQLRRAGLDHYTANKMLVHDNLSSCITALKEVKADTNIYALTTKGTKMYQQVSFTPGDCLLFGPESRGLPQEVLQQFSPEKKIKIPILQESRSLNLSNAVAIVTYEAWRQNGFLTQGSK